MKEERTFSPSVLIEHLDTFRTAITSEDVPFYVGILNQAYNFEPDETVVREEVDLHIHAASRVISAYGAGITYFTNLLAESTRKDPFDMRMKAWSFDDAALLLIRKQIVESLRSYVAYLTSEQLKRSNQNQPPEQYFSNELEDKSRLIALISVGLEKVDN